MALRIAIRGFGVADIFLILSFYWTNVYGSGLSITQSIVDHVNVLQSFGSPLFKVITIFGWVLFASVGVSGLLMLFATRAGVYLSFFQAPFRFILIIPPSFFFIKNIPIISGWVVFSLFLLALLELLKVLVQVFWLKICFRE